MTSWIPFRNYFTTTITTTNTNTTTATMQAKDVSTPVVSNLPSEPEFEQAYKGMYYTLLPMRRRVKAN